MVVTSSMGGNSIPPKSSTPRFKQAPEQPRFDQIVGKIVLLQTFFPALYPVTGPKKTLITGNHRKKYTKLRLAETRKKHIWQVTETNIFSSVISGYQLFGINRLITELTKNLDERYRSITDKRQRVELLNRLSLR